jgi:predicted DNA-binding protein
MARNQGLDTQLSAKVTDKMKARITHLEATYPVSQGDVVREVLERALPLMENTGVPEEVLSATLGGQVSVLVTTEMKARVDLLAGGPRGIGRVVRWALTVGLASVEARLKRERGRRFAAIAAEGRERDTRTVEA